MFRDEETFKTPSSPAEAAKLVFDIRDARDAKTLIPTDAFQTTATSLLETFDAVKFRALCKTAIKLGMTSVQALETLSPGTIPRNADKTEKEWPMPSPVERRKILTFFETLEKSSSRREKWRHATPRSAEPGPAQPL